MRVIWRTFRAGLAIEFIRIAVAQGFDELRKAIIADLKKSAPPSWMVSYPPPESRP